MFFLFLVPSWPPRQRANAPLQHKQHSPACEAAAQVAAIKAGWASNGNGPMNLNMSMSNISLAMNNFGNLNTTNLSSIMSTSMSNGLSNGLPDIGEDMQM